MPQMTKLRGAKMLKVVSIIMIVFGAISAVGGVITFASASLTSMTLGLDENAGQYFHMIGVISLISGLVMLVVGVVGVKNCNKAEQTVLLLVCGIILVVVTVFTNLYEQVIAPMGQQINEQVMNALQGYMQGDTVVDYSGLSNNVTSIAIGYILPILFIVGAMLNRLPPKVINRPYLYEQQADIPYLQDTITPESGTEFREDTSMEDK